MEPVRIAVIGAGLIGAKHIAYVTACPEAVLVAIADPDPAAQGLAEAHGATYWTDPRAMLAAGDIDGAIVATPTALHEAAGLSCVEAGVHALVEKPICHELDAAERLNRAAEARGVRLLTGHHRRYNPWLAEARRIIDDGEIGRIVGLSALFSVAKPADYFKPDWRRSPGGGPVLTNLIHDIDLMRALLGEIAEVSAMTSSGVRGFETEDTAVLTLRFENGALGTVFCSDTAPSPWSWEQSTGENHPTFPENDENAYRIFGTEASMEFPRLRIWRQIGGPDWTNEITVSAARPARADVYTLQMAHFARVIRGQEEPLVSGREGQRSLAATLAVFEAAATGQTVRL
ncbi:MAG: Gfo/Idh/MocA family oxidoreductase [Pseudomonadota bacterium]